MTEMHPFSSMQSGHRIGILYRQSCVFRLSPAMNQLGESLTPVPFHCPSVPSSGTSRESHNLARCLAVQRERINPAIRVHFIEALALSLL